MTFVRQTLDNNLPQRDPNVIRFVGREAELAALWRWLIDNNNPVKMITAVGGTGKTALAHEFATQVVENRPLDFEKAVWLTGKRQTYVPVLAQYVPTSRTDFSTVDDLLRNIHLQLGGTEEDTKELDRDDLVTLVRNDLQLFPSFVVVDDVDSLESQEDQRDLVMILNNI